MNNRNFNLEKNQSLNKGFNTLNNSYKDDLDNNSQVNFSFEKKEDNNNNIIISNIKFTRVNNKKIFFDNKNKYNNVREKEKSPLELKIRNSNSFNKRNNINREGKITRQFNNNAVRFVKDHNLTPKKGEIN